jgi:hypothetical protein
MFDAADVLPETSGVAGHTSLGVFLPAHLASEVAWMNAALLGPCQDLRVTWRRRLAARFRHTLSFLSQISGFSAAA